MNKLFIKTVIFVFLFYSINGCLKTDRTEWSEKYFKQAKKRITRVEKWYKFDSGIYKLEFEEKEFELYNEIGQKICEDSLGFFDYDSLGNLTEEKWCMRSCDNPVITKYFFNNQNKLIKTVKINSPVGEESIFESYFYDRNNLLIKKITGNNLNPAVEKYFYDSNNRLISKITDRDSGKIIFIDSIYYSENGKVNINKRREIGKDILKITKYIYQDTLLITEIDTTITSNKTTILITPNTIQSAYFNKTEYKYNKNEELIEKIIFQPDYKTPLRKITYEYLTELM
jgi:hypothetical protein